MGDLRVLLRYGIVGYMMLFFDLIFTCSYVGLHNLHNFVKDTQIGIIIGIIGLPIGWLCYQVWDSYINKYEIPKDENIGRIREWEKDVRNQLLEDKVQINGNLSDETIKVIANISLVYLEKKDQKTSDTIGGVFSDPRKLGHSVYSDSQQARGVMGIALAVATYFSYLLIALYMFLKFGCSFVCSPTDGILLIFAIFLPFLVSLISYWDYHRVHREQIYYAWAILSNKKDEIKGLIETFYRANVGRRRYVGAKRNRRRH